ncbi:hypothetical protein EYF80_030399 [Liparis tanakae]|uniref:Uncharacterized protein n=1 Tax=Liparis tanakae TaxID=230148 RepID=A0A4Z2H3I8_9TELE|nr:hypothetical protein EYF80_030399 [Liparis tanakae]
MVKPTLSALNQRSADLSLHIALRLLQRLVQRPLPDSATLQLGLNVGGSRGLVQTDGPTDSSGSSGA